jgi:hypothetical protein
MSENRTPIMSARRAAVAAAAVAALLIPLAGCSQKYTAERDGVKLGHGICDLKKATTSEDATDAKNQIVDQLNDLAGKFSMFTAEDRRDIDENMNDLAEHVAQGNQALIQQDLAVLKRSVGNIAEDSDEVSQAAWEGILEGLSDCV